MQRLRILLLLLFWGLVACETADIGTPTPFPTEAAVTSLPVANGQAIAVEIADLIATPEASQDTLVQITGQYYPKPKLVCDSDPHPAPATWQLESGEAIALAGGFDNELRRLLPDGLLMSVQGYWLHWRGPVGCGKRAEVQEMWYLHVVRIVDPSPIARVTLTPFLTGIEVAEAATFNPEAPSTIEVVLTPIISPTDTVPVATLAPTQAPDETPEGPDLTPTLAADAPTPTLAIAPTQIFTATTPEGEATAPGEEMTATPENGEEETREPTATLEPGAPTFTPSPVTPTNTPDPNATPTLTPTPGSSAPIRIQEDLDAGSLTKNTLAANEIQAWPFVLDESEVVTITAVTSADTTLIISIVDEERTTLMEESAPGGEVVTLGPLEIDEIGPYLIYVQSEDGLPAEYVLILLFSDSLNFIFQPLIEYGAAETIELPEDGEHFWHFVGRAGDQITFTADPDDATDVFLELYDPNAFRISAPFINTGGENGATETLQFTLPEDGLYSVRVGEWNFATGSYSFSLESN